jgi:hypothetical protein
MSDQHSLTPSEAETPSPERAKALQSLAALNLGDDLDLQGLACDPDDPDCAVDAVEVVDATGAAGPASPASPGGSATASN